MARNEYLLSLSATNAHLNRFYSEDLMELMKVCRRETVCVCVCVSVKMAASRPHDGHRKNLLIWTLVKEVHVICCLMHKG